MRIEPARPMRFEKKKNMPTAENVGHKDWQREWIGMQWDVFYARSACGKPALDELR